MSRARGSKKEALKVQKGIDQPPNINPDFKSRISGSSRKRYTAGEYVSGILSGNRTMLSQAITLVESSNPKHFETAGKILRDSLPYSGNSVRLGITGVPGAGKSTFIETFGRLLTGMGRKVAVLAIDPSSAATRGSILGDKTRMAGLSIDQNAFIRPSPAAGTLGGVARKTREIIILCEAAGFDTIIVETVGVGQSETAVSSMVDFFLLLMIAGAGDELQGIKRGIMEMADLIVINKADGDNRLRAEKAAAEFRNALHLFPPQQSGWVPEVITCSSVENRSIDKVWDTMSRYFNEMERSGWFEEKRKEQAVHAMHEAILDQLKHSFFNGEEMKKRRKSLEDQLREGKITPYMAAAFILNKYFRK